MTTSCSTWAPIRVKHLLREIDQKARGKDLPLLSVSIHHGVVRRDSLTEDEPRADDLDAYKLCAEGDVVLNRMRAFQGGVGVASEPGLVSPDYAVLRPSRLAAPSYLHHLTRSKWFVGEMSARLRGIGNDQQGNVRTPRINVADLGEIRVPLPPLPAQLAIADFLDVETTRIDALIEKKRRMIDLLVERELSEIFSRITEGTRGSPRRASSISWIAILPVDWGAPSIGMLFKVQLGKMLNAGASLGPDPRPYLRNENVQWDSIDLTDLREMHFDETERSRFEVEDDDVLVCEGGEVGRAAVWNLGRRDIYYQKALLRVRPMVPGNTRFLMYCLWAAASRGVFANEGNQSTFVHLTQEKLRAHRIPWPSADEQDEIVRLLDTRRNYLGRMRSLLNTQLGLLREHRHALITAAVTGELAMDEVSA